MMFAINLKTPRVIKQRRNALISFAYLAAGLFLGGQVQANVITLVRVGGTGSGSALVQRLVEDYRKIRPGVNFEVVMPVLGTSGSLRALAVRRIDVAVLGRPPKPEEQRDTLAVTPWAETPLVLATSSGKRANGFTAATLAGILRSRGNWDDGAHIHLVLRQPGEIDNEILSSLSPEVKSTLEAALRKPAATIAVTDLDAVDLLTRTPGSLGTTTLGMIKISGCPLTALPFNGVAASLQSLRNGSYPLAKKLYLAHERTLDGPAADFVAWLQSPAVAKRLQELDHLALPR
jgi:phosphate transport system substrate-binding protein